jgi:hypothetical protein
MSKPTSENHAFGFQLTTEQAHVFHQWQEDTFKAIVDYQLTTFKQKNPLVGEIGGLLRIFVMPHAEQWQLQIHLTKFKLLPVLEPLTITEGITPVHDKGEGSLTIQRKAYQRLLEQGWTFAHAHDYEYLFVPTSIGLFPSFRARGESDWVELSDVDEF